MDIWTVLKACVRRWYVFLPTLVIAMWFAYAQMQAMPPTYLATSSATVVGPALVPGDEPGEILEVNPFESLGGSLNATGQVLSSLMDSEPKRVQFAAEGLAADYEVSQDDAVIYFDVTGDDAQAVIATAARLVEILDTELAALQGRAVEAPESRVRAVAVSVPTVAEEDPVAGLRVFAVFAALGLILAVAASLVADAVAQSRRRRAVAAGAAGPAGAAEPGAVALEPAPLAPDAEPAPEAGHAPGSDDVTQPIVLADATAYPEAYPEGYAEAYPEGRHVDTTADAGHPGAEDLSPVGQARRRGPGV